MTINDFDENIRKALDDAAVHWVVNRNQQPMADVICVLIAKTALVSYTYALQDISESIKKAMD